MPKSKEFRVLIGPLSTEKLQVLVKLGYFTQESLVEQIQNDVNNKNQPSFVKAKSITEIISIFELRQDASIAKIKNHIVKAVHSFTDDLKERMGFSNDIDLKIPEILWENLNSYLEDDIYNVYLTTGKNESLQPVFVILIKNESTPLRVECEVPIDTKGWTENSFEKWPDMEKRTSTVWEIS
jgi:hypothetical protein